jgi:daunorubicin resistance ABC transporter membrane protein
MSPTKTASPSSGLVALAQDLAVVKVLWRRDLLRFFREKTRILGALAQPAIFWAVIGSGMTSTFRVPGSEDVSYLQFFFPGVVLMVVLFGSVFSSMSVIEDRHAGFLQAVLVAPGSRASLVLGKSLGATTLALLQAALFLGLAPLAGFPLGSVDWLLVAACLVLTALALTALGFAVAWWLDSSPAYHAFMGVALIPLWILSGAMFPAPADHPWVGAIMDFNPMSYAVDALRFGLHGGVVPPGTAHVGSVAVDLAVLAGFAAVSLGAAVLACRRRAR